MYFRFSLCCVCARSFFSSFHTHVCINLLHFVSFFPQITEALTFLHYSGHIIHRNVCPSSILVTKKGTWKLAGLEFTGELMNSIHLCTRTCVPFILELREAEKIGGIRVRYPMPNPIFVPSLTLRAIYKFATTNKPFVGWCALDACSVILFLFFIALFAPPSPRSFYSVILFPFISMEHFSGAF